MHHRGAIGRACAFLATLGSLVLAPAALADLDDVNSKRLRDGVTVGGMLAHERALQSVANTFGGTRASGTPGFDASAAYVKNRLEAAGYTVEEQSFEFPFFQELADAEMARTAPDAHTYVNGTDFATMEFSGSGDVTAPVQAVDLTLPPTPEPGSTSGCEAADFAGFTAGNIALMQRGTCTFGEKAFNAQQAGAVGAVIFNEGQPGREELLTGTLGRQDVTIPVVGTTFAVGNELAGLSGVVLHLVTSTLTETRTTKNLIADTPAGNDDQTVVVGAHLDSVVDGPGINDNGSGSSGILEIAEEMARLKIEPRRTIRFAWWGAEESGLLGSEHYVASLTPDQVAQIYANLNFDMIASPNYVRFVYDGDGSDTDTAGPPGSAGIESLFTRYFAGQGLATDPTAFDGRSDYGPFIAVGIPAGGLFSGAEGVKTEEQAATYGGTAGEPYDPCYHQACDDINNLNTRGFGELADGAAHAVYTFARSRSGLFDDSVRSRARSKRTKAMRVRGFAYDGAHARR